MEKLIGTLHHSDLEGGVWVLAAEDGRQYHLDGLPQALHREGVRLEVQGQESAQMSLGMMGAVFQVRSARAL